jgi:hypothetical protein
MTDSKGTPLSDMEERSALGKAGHGQVPFIKAGIKAKASKGVGAGDNSGVPGVGTGRARSNANGNIKTKSRVSASPEQFSNNVAETIDRIKAATSEDGATLNIDGTVYEDGGLVVPAGSVNVSQKGVSAEGLYKFLKDNENNISSDIFKIGLYKFADRAEVSYDLNIVIPREHRDVALEFGKLAGQESLFDLDSYENIKTGSDGKNPITFTPEQLASIAEDLSNGVLPDIEGMLKDTQAGTDMQDTGQIVPDKVDVEVIDKKSQYYKEAKDLVSSNVITYGEPRLVIVEKGKVVAALTLEDSDFEYKADMAVVKAERNKGLSKKLIDGMIRDFVNSNLEQIRLEVTNKNLLNNLTNNFGFESQWNEDAGADYAYMSKKQAEAYVKNNDKAGQQSLVEDKFKQYEKGYNKVQAAEGGAKKRKANEELKNILADSPSAKYIIDNMSYIYKQLEDKGLASKNDQCPI